MYTRATTIAWSAFGCSGSEHVGGFGSSGVVRRPKSTDVSRFASDLDSPRNAHHGSPHQYSVGIFPIPRYGQWVDANTDVGGRIRANMPPSLSQRQLARHAKMTPDALSRALSGQRGLSPMETARIAEALGVDTHWLITGVPDPFEVRVAARHAWDAQTRQRVNPGGQDDQVQLDRVVALYRAAFLDGPPASSELSTSPPALRRALGPSFAREFTARLEERLQVDVIRIAGLNTDYSLRVGGRSVIVLATRSSWFRSNWSLAHELGHLALGHHAVNDTSQRVQRTERSANAFASELLISDSDLAAVARLKTEAGLARKVWDLGVSTEALRNRLSKAKLSTSEVVANALSTSTPKLLRRNAGAISTRDDGIDPVTHREQLSSARQFPLSLLSALQMQTAAGSVSPIHLAWALEVPIDDLEFPEPNELLAAQASQQLLADRPSAEYWHTRITE